MKKLLLLFITALLLVTTGCSAKQSTVDVQQTLEKMISANADKNSGTMSGTMDMLTGVGTAEEISMKMKYDSVISIEDPLNIDTYNLSMNMKADMIMLGQVQEMIMDIYFSSEGVFINIGDQIKMKMPLVEDLDALYDMLEESGMGSIQNPAETTMLASKMEEFLDAKSDGKQITISINEAKKAEAIAFMQAENGDMGTVDDLVVTIVLDADTHVMISTIMEIKTTVSDPTMPATMDMKMEFKNDDNVEVVLPNDLDTYIEMTDLGLN